MDTVKKIVSVFKFIIGLLYVAIGVYLLASPDKFSMFIENPELVRVLGGLLIFYGGFRVYRAYKTDKPY